MIEELWGKDLEFHKKKNWTYITFIFKQSGTQILLCTLSNAYLHKYTDELIN